MNSSNITPDFITELKDNEIFVFGSNLEGKHFGGAARIAYNNFGAEWGVGNGPTGRCYALPTMQGGIETIRPYVNEFLDYARRHPQEQFLLTRVGCGIAGFKDSEIAPLFAEGRELANVSIPRQWIPYIL